MAQKRMFDKSLIDSDLFIDLPIPSQCLYFHLSMRADDEGFVGNVNGILRLVGFKNEDLRPLVDKRFIIIFQNGVIVIRHWKLNNYLRNDRIKDTEYQEEKQLLVEKEGKYELGIPKGNQVSPQYSIEENSIYSSNSNNKIINLEDRDKSMREEKEDIYTFTEKNFGRTINPIEIEKLQIWGEHFSEDMIRYAIELSVMNNVKTFKYIEGIINNWTSSQFTTLEQVKEREIKKGKPINGELFEYDWLNNKEE